MEKLVGSRWFAMLPALLKLLPSFLGLRAPMIQMW